MENNKDYIINIRVSKETYSKLKERAKENSQSLSGLVRKTLDDSWEIFSDLSKDLFGGEREDTSILHYQKVIVAKDVFCHSCNASIPKGTHVYVGETKTGTKKYFCDNCFSK